MNRRSQNLVAPAERIAVDIYGLMDILSCGQPTAEKIGREAQAIIKIGTRKIYSVSKVTNYINQLAEKGV